MENSSGKAAVVTTATGGMCLNIARDGRRQRHRHRLERSLEGSGGRIPWDAMSRRFAGAPEDCCDIRHCGW
jgi:hypothetical protein